MIGLGLTASTPNLVSSGPSGQTYNFQLDFESPPVIPTAFLEWTFIIQGTALRAPNNAVSGNEQQTADLLAYNSDLSSGYQQLYLDATVTITRISDSSTYVCNADLWTGSAESNGIIDWFLSPHQPSSVADRPLQGTDFTPNLPNIAAGSLAIGEYTCQVTINAPSSPVVINGDTYNATDFATPTVAVTILGQ